MRHAAGTCKEYYIVNLLFIMCGSKVVLLLKDEVCLFLCVLLICDSVNAFMA